MSKVYMNRTLGFTVPVQIPFSTPAEYDALAGAPDSWFESICAVECYSNYNTAFGNKFAEALVTLTGVAIPDDPSKPAGTKPDGSTIPAGKVTPKHYIRKLLGEKFVTEAQLEEVAQKVAAEMPPLDVSPASRSNALPKDLINKAKQLVATLAAKGTDVETWFEKVELQFPGAPRPPEETGFDDAAVARVILHVQEAQLKSLV